jgi:isopenicillin N synthase-like dioxygenase
MGQFAALFVVSTNRSLSCLSHVQVQAPPIPDTFVVNIGDMLQTWTSGLFPATPHRVVKSTKADRLSAPFFFDPNFKCLVSPLNLPGTTPGLLRLHSVSAGLHGCSDSSHTCSTY